MQQIKNWDCQTLFCSIIFINILSQFFWSSGQGSELQIRGSWVQTPLGEKCNFEIFFCFIFLTKLRLFYIVIHKKRHKWSIFYYLKVHNNCSFSFSSKMTFSVSQLDVTNFKNWDMPRKHFPEYISEMQTNILEHFFK